MPNITFDVVLMRGKKENDPVSISMPSSTTVRELKETIAGRKDREQCSIAVSIMIH